VIQRDDALLTPDEVKKHWPEVMSAIKQELETSVARHASVLDKLLM
jgi:hypothetical protein